MYFRHRSLTNCVSHWTCSRSAEPVVTQRLVRSAESVVTHKHNKNVRFEINKRVNDNNDDECGCNNAAGLVTCCIGLGCSNVEVLTSSTNTTSTQRATTNANDDDNDTTTRQHDEPLHHHHHPQTLTCPEKALPGGDFTEHPKHSVPCYRPQTENSSSSSCSASTCRRSRIPPPAVTGNCEQTGESSHNFGSSKGKIPNCFANGSIHKSH